MLVLLLQYHASVVVIPDGADVGAAASSGWAGAVSVSATGASGSVGICPSLPAWMTRPLSSFLPLLTAREISWGLYCQQRPEVAVKFMRNWFISADKTSAAHPSETFKVRHGSNRSETLSIDAFNPSNS
jgi:hypothetical protein